MNPTRLQFLPLALTLLGAPLLLAPLRWPALTFAGLGLLVVAWLVRWRVQGHLTRRTDFDGALSLLLAAIPGAWWAAPDPAMGLPRVLALCAGISLFYAIANTPWSARLWQLWLGALAFSATALASVGLLATDWNTYKYPLLRPLYAALPHLTLPGLPAGLEPNELAGVLSAYLPVALAYALLALRARRTRVGWLVLGLASAMLASVGGVLLLTQARLALAAAALVALYGLARLSARPRRIWLAALALLALSGALILLFAPRALSFADAELTWVRRVEVWERGLWTLRDFPLTGAGLGAWPLVSHAFYSYVYWNTLNMGHAHNTLLNAGAELGILGLLAALGLHRAVWRAARRSASTSIEHAQPQTADSTALHSATGARDAIADTPSLAPAILYASAGGLTIFALFGLADTIALDARGALPLWALAGTLAALAGPLPALNTNKSFSTPSPLQEPSAKQPGHLRTSADKNTSTANQPALSTPFLLTFLTLLTLLTARTNYGLVTLTRALWHTDGYALTAADPAAVSAAAAWLDAPWPGAQRGRAFIAATHNTDTPAQWQSAGTDVAHLLAWGLWAAAHPPDTDPALWPREADAWHARATHYGLTGSRQYFLLAVLDLRRTDPAAARDALLQAVALDRGWADADERRGAFYLLGVTQVQLQEFSEAEITLTRLTTELEGHADPLDLSGPYAVLGRAHLAQSHFPAAVAAYTRAALTDPENAWRWLELSAAYYAASDQPAGAHPAVSGARSAWAEALTRGLSDPWQPGWQASHAARANDWPTVDAACALALPASPATDLCAGLHAWHASDYPAAATAFAAARAAQPRDPAPAYWTGRTAEAQGDLTAALTAYRAAFTLDPADPELRTRATASPAVSGIASPAAASPAVPGISGTPPP